MVRRKDSFWEHAEEIENGRFFICKFCQKRFAGGISRIKSHLAGVRGRDIQICLQVPKGIQSQAQQAIGPPTKRAKNVAVSNNVLENESISGSSSSIGPPTKRGKNKAVSNNVLENESISGSLSSNMPNLCKTHDKSTVDEQLAKFLMLERICSDAIKSPFFIDFVNGVAEHGPGYELPNSSTLKLHLMPHIRKEVKEYVQNVIKCSVKTGCTLMYNICPYRKPFVDIFAYTPLGVACIMKIFGDFLCFEKSMSSIIELIGPTYVVQFIINDDNDEVSSAKDMLQSKYPRIYQARCAARRIELLTVKIYEVPFVYNTIQAAKWIVLYIDKHKVNVSLRRVHEKEHFYAFDVFELISLLEVESELQALQESIATLSSDWGKPCNYKQAAKNSRDAFFIDFVIHCKGFWSRGKMVAQVMQPLIQADYLVHCGGPTLGDLYEMMEIIQDAVKQCRDSNHVLYDDIWKILEKVRSDIIYPIHEASAFLNPIYMCSEKFKENDEMKNGVNHILEHLVEAEEKEDFVNQVQLYRMKDSNVFTAQAMMMLETCHPRIWWERCGNHLPVLQKCAIRILSQPCSSSLCKRYYELCERDNDDYTFMVNTMMMERYKSLEAQMKEPIILDKLGEVSDDDVYDGECDEDNEFSLPYLTHSYVDHIINDPTGSWLDRLFEELDRLSKEE